MHESSLAKQVLAAVLARARSEAVTRILAVRGWVAETEALSPTSLALHFGALARGTVAEGAVLEMRTIHVEARCLGCDFVYAPEHHVLLCPRCGGTDGKLLGKTGLGIESLEVTSP